MRQEIKFFADRDETEINLFINLQSGNFSGRSDAWFSESAIRNFIAEISEYPMRDGYKASLIGGIWDVDGKEVVRSLVELSVSPSGGRGELCVFVKLTKLMEEGLGIQCSASSKIMASYQEIEAMRASLENSILLLGQETSVVFVDCRQ